jgi:hypothetical protein
MTTFKTDRRRHVVATTKAAAVATAYGWPDYAPAMPDAEILKRLLTLNLARKAAEEA